MPMTTPNSIVDRIRANPRVPAPSHTVFQILKLTNDPESPTKRIAELISQDSGLTAQLLREANSALYGCQTRTSSVADACMRLGLKRVRSAVINKHVVDGLGRARPQGFDPQRYWQSTFAQSVAAKDVCAQLLPEAAESAATAGLLCDIGVGLLAFGIPDEYRRVLDERQHSGAAPLHEIELRILGLTHADVGAAILGDWRLEERILGAVKRHHAPPGELGDDASARFAGIVAAAAALARIALEGPEMERVALLFDYLERLTPEPDALVNRLLDDLVGHIRGSAEVMGVDLGPTDELESNFQDLLKTVPEATGGFSHRPMSRDLFESV